MEETSPQVEENADAKLAHPRLVKVTLSFDLRTGQRAQVMLDTHPAANLITIEGGLEPDHRTAELPADTTLTPDAENVGAGSVSMDGRPGEQLVEEEASSAMQLVDTQPADVYGVAVKTSGAALSISHRVNLDLPALVALFTGFTLILASIPSVLVFQDRWLLSPVLTGFFQPIWSRMAFLRGIAYPAYFIGIFLCIAALVLLFRDHDVQAVVFRHDLPQMRGERPVLPTVFRKRFSFWCFLAAGILAILVTFYNYQSHTTPGWGYLLVITLYLTGWLVREGELKPAFGVVRQNWDWLLALLVGVVCLVGFLSSFYNDLPYVWVFGLLAALAVLYLIWQNQRVPVVIWIMLGALVLYSIRLHYWAYSVIGDEMSFYTYAKELAEEHNWIFLGTHLFDGQAVHGTHPFFSSFIQMIFMRILGSNNFGWRFGNPFICALSLGLLYLFFKSFLSRRAALLTILLLACSHYIMAFGKIGYNNLQALLAMSLGLAAAAYAVQSSRGVTTEAGLSPGDLPYGNLPYVGLGLSVGFCFYVYPAALYVLPLIFLLLLMYDRPWSSAVAKRWSLTLLTAGIMILPLLLQAGYWRAKIPGTIIFNENILESGTSLLNHFVTNIFYSLLAFLYLPEESHFVTVGYVDIISATFVLIGLAFLIKVAGKEKFAKFILVGYLLILVFVGASHDRRFPPNTRMFLLLPWLAMMAVMGLEWLLGSLKKMKLPKIARRTVLVVFLLAIVFVNIYQAYTLSTRRLAGLQSIEMQFVRIVQHMLDGAPQDDQPVTFLFLTPENWGIDGFYLLQRLYEFPESRVALMREVVTSPELTGQLGELVSNPDTFVIVYPGLAAELQSALDLPLQNNGKQPCEIRTLTGDLRFRLWVNPERSWVCRLQ